MIKMNLIKIGAWGSIISFLIFSLSMICFLFVPENLESVLTYGVWIVMVAGAAKIAFIISFVMLFVGLVVDKVKPETLDQ